MVAKAPRLRFLSGVACVIAGTVALALAHPSKALAQEGIASALSATTDPNAPMVVKATEMIYDNDGKTVTALGNVQIYYDGRVLQADRVVYDRAASRLKAYGRVRITDRDGTVTSADEFDLTDDFREGFVRSLRLQTPDRTRFAAERAERSGGNVTVFENGVYTACEPCAENPEKPPLWQVKAAKIIHNNAEKMVYFEDARLEFFGVPMAYLPFFSAPDPTVKRKSGVLTPKFYVTSQLGVGAEVPYFFALAPNYDLTLTPGVTTRQGPVMSAEWRHRMLNGSYSIRATGAFQLDPDAYAGRGSGDDDFRGTLETRGEFAINQNWSWGWDVTLASDKYFRSDYAIDPSGRTEAVSSLYLTGIGTKSYFDLRSYYFLGLTDADVQSQLPVVAPVLDYDYVSDKPVFGGELGWNVNFTNLARESADFDNVSTDGCVGLLAVDKSKCILHGISGSYSRMSANLYWKRAFTDPIGQVWTPFAYLRGDLAWTKVESELAEKYVGGSEEFTARGLPAIGLEYRYPLVSHTSFGTQLIEPIAQVILRPNLAQVGKLPNEDAQSLLFDDTNIFAWDKFSGYDRIEDGSRVNAGVQYTLRTNSGATFNAMIGQSYVLGGRNPYQDGDMANVGLDSGLDTQSSDIVARFAAQPTQNLSLSARMRLDDDTFDIKRLELAAVGSLGRVSGDITYGRYVAQPALGLDQREGIRTNTSVQLNQNWAAKGGFLYDIDADQFSTASFGLAYLDECYEMSLTASRTFSTIAGEDPVDKIMLNISLRTLGEASFSRTLSQTE